MSNIENLFKKITAWKLSKYEVISGPYFPVFGLNTGKYRPETTPYLDTFHAVDLKSIYFNRCFLTICFISLTKQKYIHKMSMFSNIYPSVKNSNLFYNPKFQTEQPQATDGLFIFVGDKIESTNNFYIKYI